MLEHFGGFEFRKFLVDKLEHLLSQLILSIDYSLTFIGNKRLFCFQGINKAFCFEHFEAQLLIDIEVIGFEEFFTLFYAKIKL